MRKRFNPNQIASSDNYPASKRVHKEYLHRLHNERLEEIRSLIDEVPVTRNSSRYVHSYIKVFGQTISLSPSEAKRAEEAGYKVYHY